MSSIHFSRQSLQWTRPLLDELCEEVRRSLEQYGERAPDEQGQDLTPAIAQCGTISSSLAFLGFEGAQQLADAMGLLLKAMVDGRVEDEPAAVSTLLEASVLLPDYLDYLETTFQDAPLVILPSINEMRSMAGARGLDAGSFFASPLDHINLPAAEAGGDDASQFRLNYQHALRGLLVDNQSADAIGKLLEVARNITRAAAFPESVRRAALCAASLLEALQSKAIETSPELTRLFARFDVTLKDASSAEPAPGVEERADEVSQGFLYQLAKADASTPLAREIDDLLGLKTYLPAEGNAKVFLAGRNRELFSAVTTAAREDLARIKSAMGDQLENRSDPSELAEQIAALKRVGESISMLGLDSLANRVKLQADTLQASHPGISDDDLLKVARELLVVEFELEDGLSAGQPLEIDSANTEDQGLIPESEARRVHQHLAKEALEDLSHAKHLLDAIHRGKGEAGSLDETQAIMQRIGGALEMANLGIAARTIRAATQLAVEHLGKDSADTQVLDALSEGITATEFFLETRSTGDQRGELLLQNAHDSLLGLGLIAEDAEAANDAEPSEDTVELGLAEEDSLSIADQPDSHEIDFIDSEDLDTEEPSFAMETEEESPELLSTDQLNELASEDLDDGLDGEPLFTEETLDFEALELSDDQQTDSTSEEAETELSLDDPQFEAEVSAEVASEQAAEIEAMKEIEAELGRDSTAKLSDDSGEMDLEASEANDFSRFGDTLSSDFDFSSDVESDTVKSDDAVDSDDPFALGADEPLDSVPEQPAPPPAPVSPPLIPPSISSAFDDFDIVEIFIEEFDEELESLNSLLPAWRQSPQDSDTVTTIRRAFHSLKGSGRMAGATEIGDFAWQIENLLNRVLDGQLRTTGVIMDLVGEAVEKLPSMRDRLTGSGDGEFSTEECAALAARAEQMADGKLPIEDTPEPSITPELDDLDATLIELMVKELSENLEALQAWQAGCEDKGSPLVVPESLVRAVHTMKGTMRLAPIGSETETAQILESYLEELALCAEPPSQAGYRAIQRCLSLFEQRLERLKQNPVDDEVFDTEALSRELADLHNDAHRRRTGTSAGGVIGTLPTSLYTPAPTPASEPEAEQETGLGEDVEDELDAEASEDEIAELETELSDEVEAAFEGDISEEAITELDAPVSEDEDDQLEAELSEEIETELEPDVSEDDEDEFEAELSEEAETELKPDVSEDDQDELEAELSEEAETELEPGVSEDDEDELEAELSEDTETELETDVSEDVSEDIENIGEIEPEAEIATAEDSSNLIAVDYSDVNEDLLEAFLEEGHELLESSDAALQKWREQPNDKSLVTALQRNLHTIKGSSRMVSLNPIGQVAHILEELLEGIAAGLTETTPARIDTIEIGCDHLHSMIQAVEKRQPLPAKPIEELFAEEAEEIEETVILPELQTRDTEQATAEDSDSARASSLRIASDLVDNLVNYAGEISIFRSRLEQQVSVFRNNLGEVDGTVIRLREQLRKLELETEAQILARYEREHGPADETFDPLELDRYSTIQQLSRALAESVNDLTSLTGILDEATRVSETLLMQQSRVNTELQEGLMQARMVSFNTLLPRLRRVVRNAAREVEKKAQLVVTMAGEGELDRTVLERITAPIEHLLRNAISHGIEQPEQRRQSNKAEQGTISIDVSKEATELVLRVQDDGRGIDLDAIRRRAVERDLMDARAPLNDADLIQLIFRPGFSTAEQVSELAGRGIGMDVVANEIKQLGGSVRADTERGKGARFTIRIPLSMSVMQAIMVRTGDRQFAIPLQAVKGVTRMAAADWLTAVEAGNATQEYAGEHYPLLELEPQLGLPVEQVSSGTLSLLMVEAGEQKAALRVSDLMGHREIVLKPVGPQIKAIPGILGGTITGDGSVVPILDIGPLVRRAFEEQILPGSRGDETSTLEETVKRTPLVMVVDDSITMRRVTSRVLEHRGLEVITARDGLDAVEVMFERIPDLILLDIEMPRMDGYELASHVRNDPRLKNIPMMMITSRSGEKHRQRAQEVGVNDYLPKPYQEADLVRHVFELLNLELSEG